MLYITERSEEAVSVRNNKISWVTLVQLAVLGHTLPKDERMLLNALKVFLKKEVIYAQSHGVTLSLL